MNMPSKLTKYGNNGNIRITIRDKHTLQSLGFDKQNDILYMRKTLSCDNAITFNMTIPMLNTAWHIDIIDEMLGQPYDYQAMLQSNPNHQHANAVKRDVENIILELSRAGIIHGWQPDDYI